MQIGCYKRNTKTIQISIANIKRIVGSILKHLVPKSIAFNLRYKRNTHLKFSNINLIST